MLLTKNELIGSLLCQMYSYKTPIRAYRPDTYTVEKGVITQIDQVSSSSRAFAISDIEFVIFMGLRIDNEIKNTSRIGNKFPFLRSE